MQQMNRYDVTISPSDDFLIQKTVEVDAIGEEEAMEFIRSLSKGRVSVRMITAHRNPSGVAQRKNPAVEFFIRLKGCMRMR